MAGAGRLSETFDLYPPKAEATGSNPVGRAICFRRTCMVAFDGQQRIFLGAGLDRDRASFVEPGFQGCKQSVCGSVVEAPFAFLEVEGELRFWDAIVAAQVAFGLAPEVLDAVDMVSPLGEKLAMVDAHVAELGHVEHVVGLETVAIDHGIGLNARPDDREERCRSNVWDDHRMHLAAPLEQSEDGNLAGSAAPQGPSRICKLSASSHSDALSRHLSSTAFQTKQTRVWDV